MTTPIKKPGPSKRGGNRKPQTFRSCEQCKLTFGPLNRLSQRFCSYRCKVVAQTTGRKTFRITIPKARRAQRRIAYLIQIGQLTRPNKCEQCSKQCKTEAAHYNYDEPTNIRWLCRPCHVRWDKLDPKNATIVKRWEDFTGKTAKLLP